MFNSHGIEGETSPGPIGISAFAFERQRNNRTSRSRCNRQYAFDLTRPFAHSDQAPMSMPTAAPQNLCRHSVAIVTTHQLEVRL